MEARVRRHLPLVWALVALVLAAVLALIARDVSLWRQSVEDGDRSFQLTPGTDGLWEPDERTMPGVGRALLGLDDDLQLREAAQLFRRSRPRAAEARTTRDLAEATSAQVALSEIQLGGAPRELRSIAANQLGILAFADVLADTRETAERSKRAVQKFSEAIRLDPSNHEAMANLELILTLLRASDPRVDPEGGTSRGGGTAAGAGSGSGGRGF
jgi:hypothetical protein